MLLCEFRVECAFAFVEGTPAGEIGGERVAPVGAPTDTKDNEASAKSQRSSAPLVGHKVLESLTVFGADNGDPPRITAWWNDRCSAPMLVVCGSNQQDDTENDKQVRQTAKKPG